MIKTVVTVADYPLANLRHLVEERYPLQLHHIPPNHPIPGSWFGEPEAGLIANGLYVRDDTPIHSALHELCHHICMDQERRRLLHTNAGGDYDEENGVNLLQIILADHLSGFGREQMMNDMDSWGYSYRLGSVRAWLAEDASDAEQWLLRHQLITPDHHPTWKLRQTR
ncbi:MAG: hypothetical protein HQL48_03985 [Gammaproteobacteria bacterium]|nr:hypothetical protein [Gammaproteobacteria bacterium]